MMDTDMDTTTSLDAAALALIEQPVINDNSDYGWEPGAMLSGDRTFLFPKDGKIRVIADCYVLGIEDFVREEHLPCGPCILLVQHAEDRYFAGRFETVAKALEATNPLKYRSQADASDEETIF